MGASGFIVAYVTLWTAWGMLVSRLVARHHRGTSPDLVSCASILGSGLIPVVALALAAHLTAWIPQPHLAVLSLMTPLLMGVFVVEHLCLHARLYAAARDPQSSRALANL